MKAIQLALGGAITVLSVQALATTAFAETCAVTEYPCTETFQSDPTANLVPPQPPQIPIVDPDEPGSDSGSTSDGDVGGTGSSGGETGEERE